MLSKAKRPKPAAPVVPCPLEAILTQLAASTDPIVASWAQAALEDDGTTPAR